MLCSATLLIGNKYAVTKLEAPSFILWAQLFGTAVAVKSAHLLGLISQLDEIEPTKVRAFMPVALIFCATIFTNLKSLERVRGADVPRTGRRHVDRPKGRVAAAPRVPRGSIRGNAPRRRGGCHADRPRRRVAAPRVPRGSSEETRRDADIPRRTSIAPAGTPTSRRS